jgi:hypothetical protein
MFRIRIPYSAVIGLILGLLLALAGYQYAIPAALGVAALLEFLAAAAIIRALTRVDEFEYESFIGSLLRTYTIGKEIGIADIYNMAAARIVSYLAAAVICGGGYWDVIFVPIILFALTIMHYLPNTKPVN